MAVNVKVLRDWVNTLNSDASVAIDGGALYQCSGDQRDGGARIEIGSETEDEPSACEEDQEECDNCGWDGPASDLTSMMAGAGSCPVCDTVLRGETFPVQIPKSESLEECGFKHYHSSGHWTCTLPARHTGGHRAGGVTWLSDHRISYVHA